MVQPSTPSRAFTRWSFDLFALALAVALALWLV